MQSNMACGTRMEDRGDDSCRTARHVASVLLCLGSFVLILPGSGLAGMVVGVYVLTTVPLGAVLWDLMVALTWLPVILGVALGALTGLVMLLVRFPLLLPMLLSAAGLCSGGILCAWASTWSQDDGGAVWLPVTLSVVGAALAIVQIGRTRTLVGS